MSEPVFEEVDGESGIYSIEGGGRFPTGFPAKAKSQFAEEHDVEYNDLRAQVVDYHNEKYVIVGEING